MNKSLSQQLNPNHILSLVVLVVGLLVTNGLITNADGKLVTGISSALVSLGFLIYGAVKEHAKAKSGPAA